MEPPEVVVERGEAPLHVRRVRIALAIDRARTRDSAVERRCRAEGRPATSSPGRRERSPRSRADPPGTRRRPSSERSRPGGSSSARGSSAPSSGSSTPWASAVAPSAIAAIASASSGAWTIARIPWRRASWMSARATAGSSFGSAGRGARHHAMSSSISLISVEPSVFAFGHGRARRGGCGRKAVEVGVGGLALVPTTRPSP